MTGSNPARSTGHDIEYEEWEKEMSNALVIEGADIRRAIDVLTLIGPEYGPVALALAMGVTEQTVRNWRTGRSRPTARNFRELRDLVDDRRRAILAHQNILSARTKLELRALDRVRELLTTDVEREEERALAARLTADLEAAQHAGRRSVTTKVDPFELVSLSGRPQTEISF